tara:strand:+ start:10515 stop:10952 length:438 start_codon:yes stop_codon:yes gene_type:complete
MIALALTSTLAFSLQAATPPPEDPDCAEPLTQTAMNICAAQDFQRADAELNQVWREVRALAKSADAEPHDDGQPGYWPTLLEAQRAWLAYRDAHCRLVGYNARGGSLQPLLTANCRAELTRARTQSMRALLTNQVSGEPKTGTER